MKKLIALILLAIASVAIADTVVVTDSKVLQCKTFCDDDGKNCKVICL